MFDAVDVYESAAWENIGQSLILPGELPEPRVILAIFGSTISCHEADGGRWASNVDPRLKCYDGPHISLSSLCIAALAPLGALTTFCKAFVLLCRLDSRNEFSRQSSGEVPMLHCSGLCSV